MSTNGWGWVGFLFLVSFRSFEWLGFLGFGLRPKSLLVGKDNAQCNRLSGRS